MIFPELFTIFSTSICVLFPFDGCKNNEEIDSLFHKIYKNALNNSANPAYNELQNILKSSTNPKLNELQKLENNNENYNVLQNINDTRRTLDIFSSNRFIFSPWRFDPNYLGLDPYKESKKFGYPAENHIVKTDDGYLLTVLRIHGINSKKTLKKRPVVLLVPGIFCTAACYTDRGPGRALAYILADEGYDVWLLHPRGTTYSRNHATYDSLVNENYWDFSWHEIATIDLSNTMDYISKITKQKQLNYIGHSQGTTILFAMLSEKPEYNTKIIVAITLGPIAFLENLSNKMIRTIAEVNTHIVSLLKAFGIYDLLPRNKLLTDAIADMCNSNRSTNELEECNKWLSLGLEHQQNKIDLTNIPLIVQHYPGGASVRQMQHFAQLINKGKFTKFDYGPLKNYEKYRTETAPSYELGNINATIYLIYGETDILSTPHNVLKLHKFLPTSRLLHVDQFSHNDFLYARDASQTLYQDIRVILYEHNEDYFKKQKKIKTF